MEFLLSKFSHKDLVLEDYLANKINELSSIISQVQSYSAQLVKATNLISECFRKGNKLLLCGNGGSAAEAQHIAAEYVSCLSPHFHRKSLPAIALTTDTSFITAASNDFGYDTIFERQIESLGNRGDVLIAISTSGSSKNVISAIRRAKEKGLNIVGLTGANDGAMCSLCDVIFKVPSNNTMRIQECHLFIEHVIAELVEKELFSEQDEGR